MYHIKNTVCVQFKVLGSILIVFLFCKQSSLRFPVYFIVCFQWFSYKMQILVGLPGYSSGTDMPCTIRLLFKYFLLHGVQPICKGCKHETILEEYVPTVNGDPSKMQSLIILSLICTPLSCVTVVFFMSLNTTSLIVPFRMIDCCFSGLLYSSVVYSGLYACKCIEAFCVNYADIHVCWGGGA
jgi:hypothetical protein